MISVFVNILLNLLLIPKYGILGAALSTLITITLFDFLLNALFEETRQYLRTYIKAIHPKNLIQIKELWGD